MDSNALERARVIAKHPEYAEYIARAALLLYSIEAALYTAGAPCPLCNRPMLAHSWQCDLEGALDMMDGLDVR